MVTTTGALLFPGDSIGTADVETTVATKVGMAQLTVSEAHVVFYNVWLFLGFFPFIIWGGVGVGVAGLQNY